MYHATREKAIIPVPSLGMDWSAVVPSTELSDDWLTGSIVGGLQSEL